MPEGFVSVGFLVGVLMLLAVAGYAITIARRSKSFSDTGPDIKRYAGDAKVEPYERPSSLAAEQIEEQVKKALEGYSDLADTVFDFGTMADDTIDIWVNKRQYDDVKDIPDERIRKAIQDAVEQFNARK